MSGHLTDEEREALYHTTDYRDGDDSWAELLPLVERIVTARLAAVQALADEWERQEQHVAGTRRSAITDLRAAVAAVPADTTR